MSTRRLARQAGAADGCGGRCDASTHAGRRVRKLLTIGNLGRSWYRALQVKASGGTPSLRTVAAYTFAHADDQGNYELPEDSQNLSVRTGSRRSGYSTQPDRRRDLAASGSGRLARGWSIATLGVVRSSHRTP